jgi:hypothetical protein
MKWITRERPKIDRIACPWLIRRFIEADAEFIYVPTEMVFDVAREIGATPYDIPGAEPFSHDGELCSFDAFIKHYKLTDPALDDLAVIVRGADTRDLTLRRRRPGCMQSRSVCQPISRMTMPCLGMVWSSTTRSTPGAATSSTRCITGNRKRRPPPRRRLKPL